MTDSIIRRPAPKWASLSFIRTLINPIEAEVVPLTLTLRRLSPAFNDYRLVQISDIHMGSAGMNEERLTRIVEQVNAQQPDLVAITGDFMTRGEIAPIARALYNPLRQLRARDGVLAVLGNHDQYHDPQEMSALIRSAGIRVLINEAWSVQRGEAWLHFGGTDSYSYRRARLEAILKQIPAADAAILLAHEPDFAVHSARCGRFDLQLSGHSHGGQIVVPRLNQALLAVPNGLRYPRGQYQVGSMIQYTNRGLGMSIPPVRINCAPEITVFTLRAPDSARL